MRVPPRPAQELTHDHKARDFSGEVKLHLGHPPDKPSDKPSDKGAVQPPQPGALPPRRTYALVLPWGAPVQLKRLHLEHAAGVTEVPRLYDIPSPPDRVKYTAYGDEVTAGWCAPRSYAQLLAELNGWSVLNLGVAGGMIASEHGTTIGR